ncbi:MAG: homoserine kinase [Pseudomonadota bacterium]
MAVYTQVHLDDLEEVLKRFSLGELRSFRGIAEGVENSNYLIETDQARYILTLYEKRVAREDLPFFLGLMEHLASAGVTCPLPMRDAEGVSLFELAGRPAAVISYLDGVSIDIPAAEHCAQLGETLATLHAAQSGFDMKRPNALSVAGWRALAEQCDAEADSVSDGLSDLIAKELADLESAWDRVAALESGVIHADLFPDNVFFLHGQLSGIIDFYFACNDALAYDLAICINAWCFSPTGTLLPAHAAALLAGYQAKRALSAAELDLLPVLCRGAALRFLLTRLYDWLNPAPGAMVKPKDPLDYLARLQHFQANGFDGHS